jgi:hypothetical protein
VSLELRQFRDVWNGYSAPQKPFRTFSTHMELIGAIIIQIIICNVVWKIAQTISHYFWYREMRKAGIIKKDNPHWNVWGPIEERIPQTRKEWEKKWAEDELKKKLALDKVKRGTP